MITTASSESSPARSRFVLLSRFSWTPEISDVLLSPVGSARLVGECSPLVGAERRIMDATVKIEVSRNDFVPEKGRVEWLEKWGVQPDPVSVTFSAPLSVWAAAGVEIESNGSVAQGWCWVDRVRKTLKDAAIRLLREDPRVTEFEAAPLLEGLVRERKEQKAKEAEENAAKEAAENDLAQRCLATPVESLTVRTSRPYGGVALCSASVDIQAVIDGDALGGRTDLVEWRKAIYKRDAELKKQDAKLKEQEKANKLAAVQREIEGWLRGHGTPSQLERFQENRFPITEILPAVTEELLGQANAPKYVKLQADDHCVEFGCSCSRVRFATSVYDGPLTDGEFEVLKSVRARYPDAEVIAHAAFADRDSDCNRALVILSIRVRTIWGGYDLSFDYVCPGESRKMTLAEWNDF